MPTEWEKAFILHSRPYLESSLLLDVFSSQSGRMAVLAKGARRKRSPLKGILQPFTPLLLRSSGQGNIKTLLSAEAVSLSLPLSGSTLYSGFYINELLTLTLMNMFPAQELFIAYLNCLTQLSLGEPCVEPALRCFEFALLEHLGCHVDFMHCAASGEEIVDTMVYQYQEQKGFIASAVKIQNYSFFCGEVLRAFNARDFSDNRTRQAAKIFTRLALKPYLGNNSLKSRELFYLIK